MSNVRFNKKTKIIATVLALVALISSLVISFAVFTDRAEKTAVIQVATFSDDGYSIERSVDEAYIKAGQTTTLTLKENNLKSENIASEITMTVAWDSVVPDIYPWGNSNESSNLVIKADGTTVNYTVNSDKTITFTLPKKALSANASNVTTAVTFEIPSDFESTGTLNYTFDNIQLAQQPYGFDLSYDSTKLDDLKYSQKIVWDISKNADSMDVIAYLTKTGENYGLVIGRYANDAGNDGAMKDWTAAGKTPWYSYNISSVSFHENEDVKNIGAYAFAGESKLKSFDIPDSVSAIGNYAFDSSALTGTVTIPANVTKIGNMAFGHLPNVNAFTFEHSASDSITLPTAGSSTGAFYVDSYVKTTITTNNATIKDYDWVSDNRMKIGITDATLTYDDIGIGETADPQLVIEPDNYDDYQSIKYEVISGDEYASVDPDTGVVKGLSEGTATIRVTIVDANGDTVTAEGTVTVVNPIPTLAAQDKWFTQGSPTVNGTTVYKSDITSISFVDSYNTSGKTILDQWDASIESTGADDNEGPVTAYLEDDGSSGYKVTIAGNGSGSIFANEDSSYAFGQTSMSYNDAFWCVTNLSGLTLLDTQNTTNMAYMFYTGQNISSLDLTGWDTSKVTDMSHMFDGCRKVTSFAGISNWDVGEVTNMDSMFLSCSQLSSLNIGSWDVSKVENMSSMFSLTSSLGTLDLSGWGAKTANVKTMFNMFRGSKATSINVNGWDTRNVTDMSLMFYQCTELTTLNVNHFNMKKVDTTDNMFRLCQSLVNLDLSNWETPVLTDTSYMFCESDALESVTFGDGWDTSNVTTMFYMFTDCPSLKTLDLSNWVTTSKTNIDSFARECDSLTTIILGPDFGQEGHPTSTIFYVENYVKTTITGANDFMAAYDWVSDNRMKNLPTLAAQNTWYTQGGTSVSYEDITSISFVDSYDTSGKTIIDQWDASTESTGSSDNSGPATAYVESDGNGKYKITIVGNGSGKIYGNPDSTQAFAGFSGLETFNSGIYDTGNVTNMGGMFAYCTSLTTISGIEQWDTGNVTNMGGMFGLCSSLTSLDLSGWDTGSVTEMGAMFLNCTSLTTIGGIEQWSTGSVTNMNLMFTYCTSLTSLDLSGWDTGSVTDMGSMFGDCESLTRLDVSGWDTGSVTDMGAMFLNCTSLTSLDLSGWDTGSVTNMESMFSGCESLTSLDVSGWDTGSVTDMDKMFLGCTSLTSLDVSEWNTSSVTSMVSMFSSCESLTSLDVSGWDTSSVTNMENFANICDSLTTIILGPDFGQEGLPTSGLFYVHNYVETTITGANDFMAAYDWVVDNRMKIKPILAAKNTWYTQGGSSISYSDVTSISFVDSYDTSGKTIVDQWDASTESTGSSDESGPVTAYVESDGNGKYKVTLAGNGYGKIYGNSTSDRAFNGFSSLKTFDSGIYDTGNVTSMYGMFGNSTSLTTISGIEQWDTGSVTGMGQMFSGCTSLTSLDLSGWDTGSVTGMGQMFSGCTSLTSVDVSGWDTGDVTNMYGMFKNCTSLTSVDVSGWDTGNVTSMGQMFSDCTSLKTLDVSGWDTGSVTNMQSMFTRCSALTSLDVSGWDTGNVTYMDQMFTRCSALTSVDVSGWDTGNVTQMQSMFSGCTSLKTLDVSGWDTSSVQYMSGLFSTCKLLTTITGIEEWDTSSVTEMNGMFTYCSALTSLDLSGWDTSSVTNMAQMFRYCDSITSLDVSGWDTSSVTLMDYMFEICTSLTSLDLSGWDTSSVTNMSHIFSNCSALTSLDLSGWTFNSVTNYEAAFNAVKAVTTVSNQAAYNWINNTKSTTHFNGKLNLVAAANVASFAFYEEPAEEEFSSNEEDNTQVSNNGEDTGSETLTNGNNTDTESSESTGSTLPDAEPSEEDENLNNASEEENSSEVSRSSDNTADPQSETPVSDPSETESSEASGSSDNTEDPQTETPVSDPSETETSNS